MRRGTLLAVVVVLTGSISTVPGANVRANVTGTPSKPLIQGESVVVHFNYNDPTDLPNLGTQDVILVAWNDQLAPGGIGFGFARSLGGGPFEHTTLAGGGILPAPPGGQGRGDPLLLVDYHANLDGMGNPLVYAAQIANVGVFQDIWLSSSTDGGRTFPSASAMNISNDPAPGCPSAMGVPKVCADKPWMAIDQRGGARPPDGNVYACWTRIASDGATVTNQILLAHKTPGGTFGTPIAITPPRSSPANVQSCQVAVDIDGHVYVAWRETDDRPTVRLRHAPPPAGAAAPVSDAEVIVEQIRRRLYRSAEEIASCAAPEWILSFAASFPSLATDPYNGNVYLTWGTWNGPTAGNGPNRYDVLFTSLVRPGTRSDLRAPLRVNDDPPDAVDQYMPSITTYPLPVAPTDPGGETTVMIQWYDKRNAGVDNDAFELWADQSPFNTNDPVSDAGPEPMDPPGSLMECRHGDYNTMSSGYFTGTGPDGTGAGPVFLHSWTDTRGGGADDPEVYFQAQPVDTGPPIPTPPPRIVDVRLLNLFTQFPQIFPVIGPPIEIPFDMEFENAGPEPVTIQSWLGVRVPPGIRAGWIPSPGDGCFGPTPEGQRGPLPGTMGLGCDSEELNLLGLERQMASGTSEYLSRSLRISCEQTGVFELKVKGGTGPVLPIDVQDGDLGNNSLDSQVVVDCQPDPRPDAPDGLLWNGKSELSWQAVQAAVSYRLYRGDSDALQLLSNESPDSCLRVSTVTPDSGNVLTETPLPGAFHWYLATSVDANPLESSAGSGSSGERAQESLGDCGGCSHTVCMTGPALSPNCIDPCVADICAVDSYCCDTAWDTLCVQEVRTVCGRATCGESQGVCAHNPCTTGAALSPGCDSPPITPGCVATVCGNDPFCCDPVSGVWDLFCVQAVENVCLLGCGG